MDIATKILGHAPTGLAATIVNRGTVIVANDANYPPQSSVDQATGKLVWDQTVQAFDPSALLPAGQAKRALHVQQRSGYQRVGNKRQRLRH